MGSLMIIRILPASEFGIISIVASVFFIFLAFNGLGSNQSLLRFGSINQTVENRRELSIYLFRRGFFYQLIISVLFLLCSVFYISKYEDIFLIFLLFTVRLIGYYFLSHIQAELRISGDNRGFAMVGNVVNIAGLILLLVLSFCFGLHGYLIAVAFTPFLVFFWYRPEHFKSLTGVFDFRKKELWNFGLHAAGTALLSDALFSTDILLLSFFLDEHAVAIYKVGLLIPFNITFLAASFMQSDYPVLAKNGDDKTFLKQYIFNYYKLFIPISVVIFVFGYFFKIHIISIFFSEKYLNSQMVFLVFLAAFALNMLLRNLYGNLLSAVGMMKLNTMIAVLTLILLVVFSLVFVEKYGIMGMAISLSLSMLIGGALLAFAFYNYWKDLK